MILQFVLVMTDVWHRKASSLSTSIKFIQFVITIVEIIRYQ